MKRKPDIMWSAAKSINVEQKWRGRGYKLSSWVPGYDWAGGDGYKNFASWVDSAK